MMEKRQCFVFSEIYVNARILCCRRFSRNRGEGFYQREKHHEILRKISKLMWISVKVLCAINSNII